MSDYYSTVVIAFACVVMFVLGFVSGLGRTMNYWRVEAVKHHAAEYYLDENYNRQFRWLDEKGTK